MAAPVMCSTGHCWLIYQKEKMMLAGGINSENIPEAIKVGCLGGFKFWCGKRARHQRCDKIQRAFVALRNY